MINEVFFEGIFVKDKETGELVNIKDLSLEKYHFFLLFITKLKVAFNTVLEHKIKEVQNE